MKKLITIALVAIVPFFTMAQKRSKKEKDSSKYEFMIIKGVEVNYSQIDRDPSTDKQSGDVESQEQIQILLKGNSKFMISFDFGTGASEDDVTLRNNSQKLRTMAEAVETAGWYGWDFVNATVVDKDIALIHYYYMQRAR